MAIPLREKCPYSELFWSAFSHIRTEYGPEYGHFWRSVRDEVRDVGDELWSFLFLDIQFYQRN